MRGLGNNTNVLRESTHRKILWKLQMVLISYSHQPRAQILKRHCFFWTTTEVIPEVLIAKLKMCNYREILTGAQEKRCKSQG